MLVLLHNLNVGASQGKPKHSTRCHITHLMIYIRMYTSVFTLRGHFFLLKWERETLQTCPPDTAHQLAERLQYADLHPVTQTSLPSWDTEMCCQLGHFPRSAVGLSVLWGGVMRWCVLCPLLLMSVSWKNTEGVEVWKRARGERVSHNPPKCTGCVWLKKGCW